MAMGKINSDDHDIYYCGQESLRRNGVALIVNKTVQNSVLRWNLKKDRMISVHFQGKPFDIPVIHICAPATGDKELKVADFRTTTPSGSNTKKKKMAFVSWGLQCKRRKSRDTQNNRQVWPWSTKLSRTKGNRVLLWEHAGHKNIHVIIHMASPDGQYLYQVDYVLFCSQRWRSFIQSAKTRPRVDCGSDHWALYCKIQA